LVIGSAAWKLANKARYNLRLLAGCRRRAKRAFANENLKS